MCFCFCIICISNASSNANKKQNATIFVRLKDIFQSIFELNKYNMYTTWNVIT